jgi:hypothetical protein
MGGWEMQLFLAVPIHATPLVVKGMVLLLATQSLYEQKNWQLLCDLMTRLFRPTTVDRLHNWIHVPNFLNTLITLLLLLVVASTVTLGVDKAVVVFLMVAVFSMSYYVAASFLRRYDNHIIDLSFECLQLRDDPKALLVVTRAIIHLRAVRIQDESYLRLLKEYFEQLSKLTELKFPKEDLYSLSKCIFFLENHGYASPEMSDVKSRLTSNGYTFKL